LSDRQGRSFLARWMALALLLILVAAYRSEGFFASDEQFQVLEFAGSKLGLTPESALPWEYPYRMRPWLQPALYTLGARGLASLGVADPFAWAFAFRLFSGLVAWLGVVGLALCCERWLSEPAARRLALRALALLYFVPYLAVRTSAESLSTSCLVLAVCLVVLASERRPAAVDLGAGALLGLACALRYAAAVPALSLFAWLAIVGRSAPRRLGRMVLGLAAVLALALVVDRWGYGEWTLAAWNYAFRNFVEHRAALEFGARPWWGYLTLLALGPFGPLNLVVAAAVVVAWARHPRHVLTWMTLPLAVVQCAIAHKEVRFLFPIAMLSPVLLALALRGYTPRGWRRALATGVVAYDLAGLAALCLLPAQPQVAFLDFVHRRFANGLEAYLAAPSSPWDWRTLTLHFYGEPPRGLRPWPGTVELAAEGATEWKLVTSSWDGLPSVAPYSCRPLYRSMPAWLAHGSGSSLEGRLAGWELYRCGLSGPQGALARRAPTGILAGARTAPVAAPERERSGR
jgi:phosphatidylinositol glycan class B